MYILFLNEMCKYLHLTYIHRTTVIILIPLFSIFIRLIIRR